MADRNVIRGRVGLDTKDAKESLNDLEKHGRDFGHKFSSLFKLEPAGERRGGHALSRLVEGMTELGTSSQGAFSAVSNLGRALSVGIGAGVGIGAVTAFSQKFIEVNEEAVKLQSTIANLGARGAQSGAFEGLDHMRETLHQSTDAADQLRLKLTTFNKGGALGNLAREIEAMFQGKSGEALGKDIEEQIGSLNKTAGDQLGKIAAKNAEISKIEETRFHTSEHQADLMAEELKNRETLGMLSEEETLTHTRNQSALTEENRRHEEAKKILEIKGQDMQRELDLSSATAQAQLRIANITKQGLTHEQQSLAVAKEKVSLAKQELEAAQQAVEAAQDKSEEEKQRANTRLARAQAGVAGAATGAAEAAGSQLEREGAEEAMSPEEKQKQYAQRVRQAEGIRHAAARRGIRSDIIRMPKYGEADYDPTADYRSAVARRTEETSGATLREKLRAQVPQEAEAVADSIARNKAAFEAGEGSINFGAMAGPKRDLSMYGRDMGYTGQDWSKRLPSNANMHQMSKAPWASERQFSDFFRGLQDQQQPASAVPPRVNLPGPTPSGLPSPSGTPPQASAANDPLTMTGMRSLFQQVFGA